MLTVFILKQISMTDAELLVKHVINKFQEKGLDVLYAKCDGYPDPVEIKNVVPDVVGWDPHKELYHLGLVANSPNVISDLTLEKINILAGMMMSTGTSEGKRLPFYLGFPKDSANDVNRHLQKIDAVTQENIVKLEA